MAAVSTIIAGIGLGLTAVGTVNQMQAQRKATSAQKKMRNLETARQRREQIRQARIARANIASGAVASGTERTSGAISGMGQIGTQLGSNLSFMDSVGAQANIAGDAMSSANMWGGVANIGSSIFSNAGTLADLLPSGSTSRTPTNTAPNVSQYTPSGYKGAYGF